jgi:hypothetical protein
MRPTIILLMLSFYSFLLWDSHAAGNDASTSPTQQQIETESLVRDVRDGKKPPEVAALRSMSPAQRNAIALTIANLIKEKSFRTEQLSPMLGVCQLRLLLAYVENNLVTDPAIIPSLMEGYKWGPTDKNGHFPLEAQMCERILNRLTRRNFPPDAFHASSMQQEKLDQAYAAWKNWWAKNKDLNPLVTAEIEAQVSSTTQALLTQINSLKSKFPELNSFPSGSNWSPPAPEQGTVVGVNSSVVYEYTPFMRANASFHNGHNSNEIWVMFFCRFKEIERPKGIDGANGGHCPQNLAQFEEKIYSCQFEKTEILLEIFASSSNPELMKALKEAVSETPVPIPRI